MSREQEEEEHTDRDRGTGECRQEGEGVVTTTLERMRQRGWRREAMIRNVRNHAFTTTTRSHLYFWHRIVLGVPVTIRERADGRVELACGGGRSLTCSSPLAAAQRAAGLARQSHRRRAAAISNARGVTFRRDWDAFFAQRRQAGVS